MLAQGRHADDAHAAEVVVLNEVLGHAHLPERPRASARVHERPAVF